MPAEAQTRLFLSFSQMSGKDFEWVNDHEFRYQGQMYDVLSQEPASHGVQFSCLKDEDETRLFRTLDDQVASLLEQDAGTRKQSARTIDFYQHWICVPAASLLPEYARVEEKAPTTLNFRLPPGHRNEIFAPPENIFS